MQLPATLSEERRRDIGFVAALGVVQAVLMMASAFATRDVFVAISGGGNPPLPAFAALVLAPTLLAASQAFARIRAEAIGQSFAIELRRVLFEAISRMPPEQREKRRLGGLSLRFVGDLTAARSWVGLGITRLISGAIVMPAAFICLWMLNPALAVAGIAPIVASSVLFIMVGLTLKRMHVGLRKGRASIAIIAMERISQARELALLGRTPRETAFLDKKGRNAARLALRRIRATSLLRAIPNASLGLGSVAILWTSLAQGLSTGETAAALSVLAILTVPFRELVGVWDRISAWSVARGKCQNLLDAANEAIDMRRVGSAVPVRVRHANFADGIDVPAGSTARIKLRSPDTTSKLLRTIAQRDRCPKVTSIDFSTEQKPLIALVTDKPIVLRGSIRRALTMGGAVRPSDESIMDVVRQIGLERCIANLGGLDGRISEAAANLLPSQALCISIAQAILSKADLIVIDSLLWPHLHDPSALFAILNKNTACTVIHSLPVPSDCEIAEDGLVSIETNLQPDFLEARHA